MPRLTWKFFCLTLVAFRAPSPEAALRLGGSPYRTALARHSNTPILQHSILTLSSCLPAPRVSVALTRTRRTEQSPATGTSPGRPGPTPIVSKYSSSRPEDSERSKQ